MFTGLPVLLNVASNEFTIPIQALIPVELNAVVPTEILYQSFGYLQDWQM